jgi:hypothetical protein
MYVMLLYVYGVVRNGFEAGKIYYEGHWKGWVPLGPKKVEISRTHLFQCPD